VQNELILVGKLEKKELLFVMVHAWTTMLANKPNWYTALIQGKYKLQPQVKK